MQLERGGKMKRTYLWLALSLVVACVNFGSAVAHCEVPCGIYDDEMRTKMIAEHATTIEKAMNQISELSGQMPLNQNQITRWVTNKELHASEVQHIVSQYFLTQRIKPDADKYGKKLEVLHQMLLAAMKCKQTVDTSNVDKLRSLLKEFELLYFGHVHVK
jgi:nickel superoxide dismutase